MAWASRRGAVGTTGATVRIVAAAGTAVVLLSAAAADADLSSRGIALWAGITVAAALLAAPYALGLALAPWIAPVRRVIAASVWPSAIALELAWAASLAPHRLRHADFWTDLAGLAVAGLAVDGALCAGAALRAPGRLRRASAFGAAALATAAITGGSGLAAYLVERLPAPGPPPTRYARVLRFFGTLRDRYPHWDRAPLTARELLDRHRDALRGADRTCSTRPGPCPEMLAALRTAFADLGNGHVFVEGESDLSQPDVDVGVVEGRPVVLWAPPGAGIAAGDVVERIDGLPVAAALGRVPAFATADSSEHARRRDAHDAILAGAPGTYVQVLVRRDDGSLHAARFERPRANVPPAVVPELEEAAGDAGEQGPALDWDPGAEGPLVVAVDHLEGDRFADEVDDALAAVRKAGGAVLDLRECPGGYPENIEALLDRLFDEPLELGEFCGTEEDGSFACDPLRVEPAPDPFLGPLAVVVNGGTASAGELAAYGLCSSGRARCFGTRTAGDTDLAERRGFDGTTISLAVAEFRPASGPSLLGRGLRPHVVVAPTIADVRAGRDPALEAALSWVAKAQARSR